MPSREVVQHRPMNEVSFAGTNAVAPATSTELVASHNVAEHGTLEVPSRTQELVHQPGNTREAPITFVVSGLTEGSERQSAREAAHRRFDNDMAAGGGALRRFGRKLIKGNFLREGLMARNRNRAQAEITETGRLDGMSEAQWQDVTAESIQRVLDDEGTMEYMHRGAGERRDQLQGDQGRPIKDLMNSLLTAYVGGQLDRDNLQEEARRRLAELAAGNEEVRDLIGEGSVYMSNIVDIAETVRAQATHERGLQSVLDRIEYVSARVKTNANTEARASTVEKFLDKSPVNAAWASVAFATIYGLSFAAGKSALSKITRVAGVGVGSALMAYGQEKSRLAFERGQVARETEMGENVSGTARRDKLAATMYDMKRADVLTDALRSLRNPEDKYDVTNETEFASLSAAVAELTARHDLSGVDLRGVDGFEGRREQIVSFISHSSAEKKPAEVRAMMAERFKARAALRRYYDTQRQADPNFMGGADFDAYMTRTVGEVGQVLLTNVVEQDKNYDSLSRKEAWKSAARGVLLGVAFGEATQEATSLLNEHVQGIVEFLRHTNMRAEALSSLAYAARVLRGGPEVSGAGSSNLTEHVIGSNTFKIDANIHEVAQVGDHLNVTTADGAQLSVAVDGHGNPTGAGLDVLRQHGFAVTDTQTGVQETNYVTSTVGADKFAQDHGGVKVERSWFDNDTPAFDKNELRLDLKTDGQGNFVYNVGRMVEGDSYHGGNQATLDYSHMKILISPTEGTQATPIPVDIDANGNAIIPKDSPLAQMFKIDNGNPEFLGKFAEVAQVNTTATDGSMNVSMLATQVGLGESSSFTEHIPQTIDTLRHTITVTQLAEQAPYASAGIELPPIVTLPARDGLRREPAPRQSEEPPEPSSGTGQDVAPLARETPETEQNPTGRDVVPVTPNVGREAQVYRRVYEAQSDGRPAESGHVGREEDELSRRRRERARRQAAAVAEAQRRRTSEQHDNERRRSRTAAEQRRQSDRERRSGTVDGEGLTPAQWAQDHSDYREAMEEVNSARDSASQKRARRNATRVYRDLQAYYERKLRKDAGRNARDEVTLSDGATVYERVAVDPRYVAAEDKVDKLRDIEEALKTTVQPGVADVESVKRRGQYEKAKLERLKAQQELLMLRGELLFEYHRNTSNQQQKAA